MMPVCNATFTPLCFMVYGLVGDTAACFLKHLGSSLSMPCKYHYGEAISSIGVCLGSSN